VRDRKDLVCQGAEDVTRGRFWRPLAPDHTNGPSVLIGAAVFGAYESEDTGCIERSLVSPEWLQDRAKTLLDGIPPG